MKFIGPSVIATALALLFCGTAFGADELVVTLMQKGAAKDTTGLIEFQGRAMASPATRYAYHLARFMADPDGYAATFIAEFPTTSGGVMGYAYQLELATDADGKGLTPYFPYAFDELGKLAIGGNSSAIAKVYLARLHSDGVVTGSLCQSVSKVLASQPVVGLNELEKLSIEQRQGVYSCFGSASAGEISRVRKAMTEPLGGSEKVIASEVIKALDEAY
jgi:hypothetical protein